MTYTKLRFLSVHAVAIYFWVVVNKAARKRICTSSEQRTPPKDQKASTPDDSHRFFVLHKLSGLHLHIFWWSRNSQSVGRRRYRRKRTKRRLNLFSNILNIISPQLERIMTPMTTTTMTVTMMETTLSFAFFVRPHVRLFPTDGRTIHPTGGGRHRGRWLKLESFPGLFSVSFLWRMIKSFLLTESYLYYVNFYLEGRKSTNEKRKISNFQYSFLRECSFAERKSESYYGLTFQCFILNWANFDWRRRCNILKAVRLSRYWMAVYETLNR